MRIFIVFIATRINRKELRNPCAPTASHVLHLFLLKLKAVGDHGNKLRIGGLSLHVGDGIAEVFLQGFQAVYRMVYSYKTLLFSGFLI